MKQGGWSEQLMRTVLRNMSQLIEIECKKFETIFKITMCSDLLVDVEVKNTLRKLINKGEKTFDSSTLTSPVMEQIITNIINKVDYNIN